MQIIELVLDEENEDAGIDCIAIVENPAIESNFVALKKQESIQLAEVDKEKRLLMGALLIPNKPIYRNGPDGEEYYIFFSKETIAKASQMYLQNGNQSNSNIEHGEKDLEGLTLVETWLVADEKMDKSRVYGIDVPVGTWMGAVKVNNEEVWNDYVKTGKVKAFSIEGYFVDKMEQKSKVKEDLELSEDLIIDKIKNILNKKN
jgi:hypothetical protein|tara:strand:+ start:176 stop:784 length:609 start_codon:yes stop_codon:yes gene_type:complete